MKRLLWALLLCTGISIVASAGPPPSPAQAGQGWKEEFEAVCSKTDAAMTLGTEELKELVARCDRLKERIESEDETSRRIYLRRLKSCRDLYEYVLETRRRE